MELRLMRESHTRIQILEQLWVWVNNKLCVISYTNDLTLTRCQWNTRLMFPFQWIHLNNTSPNIALVSNVLLHSTEGGICQMK